MTEKRGAFAHGQPLGGGWMGGMTNLTPWALALGTVLCIAGCATPYTEHGIGLPGGVEAQMITGETARISARGNAYTDRARITDFVLPKAAQTALAKGFTHFAMISSAGASRTGQIETPGMMQTNVYGNTAFTTYTPGSVETFVKPGEDVFVRFCKVNCTGMFPAQEIVNNLGPKYLPPAPAAS